MLIESEDIIALSYTIIIFYDAAVYIFTAVQAFLIVYGFIILFSDSNRQSTFFGVDSNKSRLTTGLIMIICGISIAQIDHIASALTTDILSIRNPLEHMTFERIDATIVQPHILSIRLFALLFTLFGYIMMGMGIHSAALDNNNNVSGARAFFMKTIAGLILIVLGNYYSTYQ